MHHSSVAARRQKNSHARPAAPDGRALRCPLLSKLRLAMARNHSHANVMLFVHPTCRSHAFQDPIVVKKQEADNNQTLASIAHFFKTSQWYINCTSMHPRSMDILYFSTCRNRQTSAAAPVGFVLQQVVRCLVPQVERRLVAPGGGGLFFASPGSSQNTCGRTLRWVSGPSWNLSVHAGMATSYARRRALHLRCCCGDEIGSGFALFFGPKYGPGKPSHGFPCAQQIFAATASKPAAAAPLGLLVHQVERRLVPQVERRLVAPGGRGLFFPSPGESRNTCGRTPQWVCGPSWIRLLFGPKSGPGKPSHGSPCAQQILAEHARWRNLAQETVFNLCDDVGVSRAQRRLLRLGAHSLCHRWNAASPPRAAWLQLPDSLSK